MIDDPNRTKGKPTQTSIEEIHIGSLTFILGRTSAHSRCSCGSRFDLALSTVDTEAIGVGNVVCAGRTDGIHLVLARRSDKLVREGSGSVVTITRSFVAGGDALGSMKTDVFTDTAHGNLVLTLSEDMLRKGR